jgi:hypothetical protein
LKVRISDKKKLLIHKTYLIEATASALMVRHCALREPLGRTYGIGAKLL